VDGTAYDLRNGLPLVRQRYDTAFTDLDRAADGTSTVTLAADGMRIEIWADAAFGWWQVYTSDWFDAGHPRYRRSVAVEPMTCGPDAFNTGDGLIVLPAGARWRGSWGARYRQQ
jgi:aldose 1-epimerase